MKLDSKLSQISSANAGVAYFFPKKTDGSPLAAAVEKLKTQRQLSQILATFEQEKDLPTFTEGEPEQILQARMCRYVILLQGWGLQVAPEELTHAATWTALAAA